VGIGQRRVRPSHAPFLGRDREGVHLLPVLTRSRKTGESYAAASALNHPNIVTIYDIDSVDGIDFIVMEYVSGKSLDRLIRPRGMRLGEVLKTAIQIADALARAQGRRGRRFPGWVGANIEKVYGDMEAKRY
jgi:serine/threonine protein kinase